MTAKIASFLTALTIFSFICLCYLTGFISLWITLNLLSRVFTALLYYKVLFKYLEFLSSKRQLISLNSLLALPFFCILFLGLFVVEGGVLLILTELAQALKENPKPLEIERHLFKDVEQIESPAESEIEPEEGEIDTEETENDIIAFLFALTLLVAIEVLVSVFFY